MWNGFDLDGGDLVTLTYQLQCASTHFILLRVHVLTNSWRDISAYVHASRLCRRRRPPGLEVGTTDGDLVSSHRHPSVLRYDASGSV